MLRSDRTLKGFSLIEVLVVVAIISLLLAVLLPSLSRAREQARIAKCLGHMSNLPKAVLTFAHEHRGYAQTVARGYDNNFQILAAGPDWAKIDPQHQRYAYQPGLKMGSLNTSLPMLKAWPVAYGPYIGENSLKRMEQYCDSVNDPSPSYYHSKFGKREIFTCPSDQDQVRDMWSPGTMYGLLSYAANEDVFGISEGAWKEGLPHNTRAPRLQGRMDWIIRPSEVALFADGGIENKPGGRILLVTWGDFNGPFLENYEIVASRLPKRRHSLDGGLNVGFADGSGKYVKPLEWVMQNGQRYVKRYTPKVRVSPYEVGNLRAAQP